MKWLRRIAAAPLLLLALICVIGAVRIFTHDLLLRPLSEESGVPVLPAVDPIGEADTARGVVVAQVFAIKPGERNVETFAVAASKRFASYRSAGGAAALERTDLLHGSPEWIVLDPTPRSRLRWLPG